jgi:hypothetical protein
MNQALGKNTLANLMKTISKQAGLSREFTNLSIRATSITVLDVNNFSDRNIMCVSGHKTESSIKNYTGRVTTSRKYEISNALCASVINDVQVELRLSQERLDGELNLSQEQIDELMAPMENLEQELDENSPTTTVDIHPGPAKQTVQTMSNIHTISVDVHPEPQKQAVQTLLNTTGMPNVIDSVLRPIENIPFTHMISNCVVTFTVNLNSK